LQSIYDSFLLQTKGALFKTVDYLPFPFLAICFPYLLPMVFLVGSLLHFPPCLFNPLPSSTPFCCPDLLNSHTYAKKPSLNINQQCKCPILQLSFSLSSQSFFAQFLPLFSTLYISLWDAMNKLWCGPVGNEFKRWRVRINKGGGEIDGHKKNSQHFRANFQKVIGCSM
jgi:hypothetical protein